MIPGLEDLQYTTQGAQAEVDRAAWPAFVSNEMSEVVVANAVALSLWGLDLRDYPTIGDRSMLSFVSDPRFADRIANWDEAVGTIASVFKGHFRGGEDLDDPSPVFRTMLEKFLAGDPGVCRALPAAVAGGGACAVPDAVALPRGVGGAGGGADGVRRGGEQLQPARGVVVQRLGAGGCGFVGGAQ